MFDNLNYIMNSRSHKGCNNFGQIYPYDLTRIKELLVDNTINDAYFNSGSLKRRYGLPVTVQRGYEYEVNKTKLKELKEKFIPNRNNKKQLIFGNRYDNLDASITIMDCQLGFNLLRSKIDKMKRIADKVLNDEFEYKYKESPLFEFKWRMDQKRVNDDDIFKDKTKDRKKNDIPQYIEGDKIVDSNFSKNGDIGINLPKVDIDKINKICHELNENFIQEKSLKNRKYSHKEEFISEKDLNIHGKDIRLSLEKKETAFFVKESPYDLCNEIEDENKVLYSNEFEDKQDSYCTEYLEDDDIDLISSELAEFINRSIPATENHVEEFKLNERKNFTVKDKNFSFKQFINFADVNVSGNEEDKYKKNSLNSNEMNKKNLKSKHIKKKSLSSLELISLLNINRRPDENKYLPVEVESTKTSCKLNSLKTNDKEENYIFTTDMLTESYHNDTCEVNISGFDFNEIFEEEDTQHYKHIGLQRLNYFLEENEKEDKQEKIKEESQIDNFKEKSDVIDSKYLKEFYLNNSYQKTEKKQNISLYDKYYCKIKNPHLCKKFKKNPFMFYSEYPDDDVLKMCNMTTPELKFGNEKSNNKSVVSNKNNKNIKYKSNNKEKKSRDIIISTLERLTLSEIK